MGTSSFAKEANGSDVPRNLFSKHVQGAHSASQFSDFGGPSLDSHNREPIQAPVIEASFLQAPLAATVAGLGGDSFQPTFTANSFSQMDSNSFLQTAPSQAELQWNSQNVPNDLAQPQQSFDFGAVDAQPHDHTIQPSQIDNVLSNSFGPTTGQTIDQNSPMTAAYDSTTPPFSNSYMPSQAASQAISLLSDDEDEEDGEQEGGEEYTDDNGSNIGVDNNVDASRSFRSVNYPAGLDASTHSNRFAALADDGGEDDSDESQGESVQQKTLDAQTGSDIEDIEDSEDEHEHQHQRTSYQYDDDDEVSDGPDEDDMEPNGVDYYDEDGNSISRGDEEDDADTEGSFDEEDEDDYDEEDDEDRTSGQFGQLPPFGGPRASQGNRALHVVGNNVEEAIELSD
jgi:hypothetical protein